MLASASPRRVELLRLLGVPFEVVPSDLPEEWPPRPAERAVAALALAKARAVARQLGGGLVLGADTAVVLAGAAFGKPENPDDARRMLRTLRGRVHEVITGVALVEAPDGREAARAVVTRVRMREYTDAEIEASIASGEPFDKAGAYGIQAAGGALVAEVDGCYTNVVGLPLTTTRRMLEAWGVISGPRAS